MKSFASLIAACTRYCAIIRSFHFQFHLSLTTSISPSRHSARSSDSKSRTPPPNMSSSDTESEGRQSPAAGAAAAGAGVVNLLCGRFRPGKSKSQHAAGGASPGNNPFQSKFATSPGPAQPLPKQISDAEAGPSALDAGYAGDCR